MKFLSFTKNRSLLLVTVLMVVLLGALYFFVYIPGNTKYVNDRHFKCLQNVETNIHAKLENSIGLLNNLLDTEIKNLPEYNKDSLHNYIKRYSRENFIILPIETAALPKETKDAGVTGDSLCKITFKNRELLIELYKKNLKIGLIYKVDKFLKPLLPDDKFNEYLLLSDENIVYQTFPSGITAITKDSLPSKKSAFLHRSDIKTIELTGTSYKFFPQQLNLAGEQTSLTLAGLLANDRYEHLKKKLPENISLLLLTLAIVLILSLPWIKLYQMGNRDRLTVSDGLSSFAVAMLLMSTLFFMFLKYNAYLRPEKNDSELSRENIALGIEKAFTEEIKAAYQTLSRLDLLRKNENYITRSVGVTANFADKDNRRIIDTLKSVSGKLNINYVYWLNPRGEELASWSMTREIGPPSNFGSRDYFKKIKSGNAVFSLDPGGDFYLEPVNSLTRSTFTTVISKPSIRPDEVAALSFNLKSVHKTVLPEGFLFALINKEGKVLYHSNEFKNLNENLPEEFTSSESLKTILTGGGTGFFKTEYLGREFVVSAKPFSSFPYHILVLEDTSSKHLRDTNIFSFNFSMLFAFFFILILELAAVFLVSRKHSFLKKQYSDISWVGPRDCFRLEYATAVLINTVIIIMLCIFRTIGFSFLQYLFLLLTCCTAISLVLNQLYLEFYRKNSPEKYSLKLSARNVLWVIIAFENAVALAVLQQEFPAFFFSELFLLSLCLLVLLFSPQIFTALKKVAGSKNRSLDSFSGYSLMLFTRFIITSGIPVVLFYSAITAYELRLTARNKHVLYLADIVEKSKISKSGSLNPSGIYYDSIWVNPIFPVRPTIKAFSLTDQDRFTSNLFRYFTGFDLFNAPGNEQNKESSSIGPTSCDNIFRSGQATTIYRTSANTFFQLNSKNLRYTLPKFDLKGILFWFLLLTGLMVFWKALDSILRKLFAGNLPVTAGWEDIDEVILTDSGLNNLIFMIGSPGSGKTTKLKNYIKDGKVTGKKNVKLIYDEENPENNNVFKLDMILIPSNVSEAGTDPDWIAAKTEVFSQKHELIIVNHFEYDIKNDATNRIKLDFLETLLQRNQGKVIVVSTVHPVSFLDSLNDQDAYKAGDQRLPKHDLDRWHVLLGHFKIVIAKINPDVINLKPNSATWRKGLLLETSSSQFLNNLYIPLKPILQKLTPAPQADSLAFKLQITSHYFYMYIWQSLTKEEKFLLWDLAEDGLVNSFDDYNLSLLISKGIIVRNDGQLSLFNKGFRNFILTAIGKAEVMAIRREIEDNGNWRKLRQPFFILIVAVLAFLYASQQDTYKTLLAYLGILTAALPAVLKFFSLFESNSQKTG